MVRIVESMGLQSSNTVVNPRSQFLFTSNTHLIVSILIFELFFNKGA